MKRLSSLLLTFLLVLLCSVPCFAQTDNIQPVDYEVTNGVYYIYTPEHLNWIAYQVENGYDFSGYEIRLMNDIKFVNMEFRPIGTYHTNFNGFFNGNGHTIDYANVNLQDAYVGIFRYIGCYGKVQNLTVGSCCRITGNACVGGIAGYNAGKIIHCCSKADVVARISTGAGLVGYNDSTGCIYDCQRCVLSKVNNRYVDNSCAYVARNLGSCLKCDVFFFYPW